MREDFDYPLPITITHYLEVARLLGLDLGLELLQKSRLDLVSKNYFRDELSRINRFVEEKIAKKLRKWMGFWQNSAKIRKTWNQIFFFQMELFISLKLSTELECN